ncbi:glycerol-3-phosphate ABC transporter ATP-binding protein [Ammoniphilus oxalaticus]|uniref:Glycerol-3-phosphate ABC transporter ATP-binding protein n=1 Tax=Ammoniphilus oxalaticus TaxID=66863 RepID=A0A419SP06_9BACL|nr:sn-glycerol-3-phosphate ABC transporter ATP-binding protein UgpC [Ammoniphilus oxalaticus]RKD25959.1 glycerol-3-phosphate ABC transporter ATP-binding protein [Ammoniphilus oxalaticus]
MASLTFHHVKKKYNDQTWAVRDFHLNIFDEEFLVLVGPSGCGKSTTLRMVAGLEEITEGELYIGDRLVNNVEPKDRDIAMVFQNYALYPHMSVYNNMAFGLKLRKFSKVEIEQRIRHAANILGIETLLDRKPKALSGGQRQRVALGRAIVREPQVFLMDEPLSNLDAKLRVQMRAEISKLHQRLKTTVVYVTHDQTEAMTMGDRIVVMNNGLIQQVGTPQEIYHKPTNLFVAGFIGTPPMNLIDGRLTKDNETLYFQSETLLLPIPEEKAMPLLKKGEAHHPVTLGIRPENIHNRLHSQDSKNGTAIEATVDIVENTGSEIFVYLSAGKTNLTARLQQETPPKVGSKIELWVDMNKAYFFNGETEKTIF